MITIFNQRRRGIGEDGKESIYMQVDVALRDYIYLFSNQTNLNPLGVFLAVALHANRYGWSYPSRDLLKRETGIGSDLALSNAITHLRGMKINGQRVLATYRERDPKTGYLGRMAFLIFPDVATADSEENAPWPHMTVFVPPEKPPRPPRSQRKKATLDVAKRDVAERHAESRDDIKDSHSVTITTEEDFCASAETPADDFADTDSGDALPDLADVCEALDVRGNVRVETRDDAQVLAEHVAAAHTNGHVAASASDEEWDQIAALQRDPPPKRTRKRTPRDDMFDAIADACYLDTRLKATASYCAKYITDFLQAGYSPQEVLNTKAYHEREEWGRQHHMNPTQLAQKIAQGAHYVPGAPNGNGARASPPERPDPPAQRKLEELRRQQGGGVREA